MHARIVGLHLTDTHVFAHFADERQIGCPIAWFPNLRRGSAQARTQYVIAPDGQSLHWPTLDEDLSAEGFFTYKKPITT